MPSKTARQKDQATIIFQSIQDSPALQDILAIATSDNQKIFFISKLLAILPNAFLNHTNSPQQLFDVLTIWFGKYQHASSGFDAVVRGHLRAPMSLMEYVRLTTPDTLHLADTPYIPPHHRRPHHSSPTISLSQPPLTNQAQSWT